MKLSTFLSALPADIETESDGWLAHCPSHSDSKPSLRVAVSDKGRLLIKCRAGCETETVLDSMGLSFSDIGTVDVDVALQGVATSQDVPAGAADVAALAHRLDLWNEQLCAHQGAATTQAQEYAEERFGLDYFDMKRLGLGVADDLGGGPRLVVPFRDPDGVPRGFQARALDPAAGVRWLGPKSPNGASWSKIAWLPGSSGWDEVLITEGPGDGLTAVAIGYDTILVRGAGLVNNPATVDQIASWLGDRLAVVAGDGDPSGRTFSSTLAQGIIERGGRAKILPLPDGLDLTDWREQAGPRFATEVIRAITRAPEETSSTATLATREISRYPLTDLGNARYVRDFVRSHGSGVRYSPEVGFFLLNDGVWRADKLDTTRSYAQSAADSVARIAKQLYETAGTDGDKIKEAARWHRWAQHSQSTQGINAALRELQALPDVSADVNDFDKHPDLLAARNGVVNLRTGELLPHDPAYLLTRRVEIDYDPAATAPRWVQFLTEVFPSHPDLPAYVQRLIGYGITGHTSEQCFAVLWGTGANGKSVFTDTLTEVFRELTITTPFSTFEDRGSGGIPNDIAALKGARLVMAAEGEQGRPMAEAVLKRVTGRDLIAARFMRKEFFEFRPTFLLLLATNFKPSFKGQDEGLWRRVKLVPWDRYFAPAERDHTLGDTLLSESAGILTWAVEGAREWYRSGLRDPETIRASTGEYRENSDALAGFLPGLYVKDPRARRLLGKTLFDDYLLWADEENLPPRERWTRKTFYAALEERGAVRRAAGEGAAFEGLRRVRATDAEPNHDSPEVERAATPTQAHSSGVTASPPIAGPSLDDLFS